MALAKSKTNTLFQYYLQNGFDHTVDEIAIALGVTHKTFFNRYGSKANSIQAARKYWHDLISERFRTKMLQCNHSVEELLFFVLEIQLIRKNEMVFFQFENEVRYFITDETPLKDILESILQKGIRHYHFEESIDRDSYIPFLIQNLCDYLPIAENKVQTIKYLLLPLLTERGQELLEELDIHCFIVS